MTREELKENICGMTYDDMFEYIYNFENRTCENCKYIQHLNTFVYDDPYRCEKGIGDRNAYGYIYTSLDFGCNKFERKT